MGRDWRLVGRNLLPGRCLVVGASLRGANCYGEECPIARRGTQLHSYTHKDRIPAIPCAPRSYATGN